PPRAGELLERLEPVPHLVVRLEALLRKAAARGRPLAAAPLACQQAAGERKERDHADSHSLASGEQLVLCLALEQRVLVLRRDEAREPALVRDLVRFDDLCGAELRR